jgi:hypothetical protein
MRSQNGINSGCNQGNEMTKPREFPTVAAEARDQAAEHTQEALILIEPMANQDTRLMKACLELVKALRWLESVGASTKPERM